MNCFNHPETPAVGICKACHKGLCIKCLVEVGEGLACKGACEANVEAINDLLHCGRQAYERTRRADKRDANFFFVVGVALLIFAAGVSVIEVPKVIAIYLGVSGAGFILGGILSLRSGRAAR